MNHNHGVPACTSQLISCVGGLVSYLSAITALATWDIISTGIRQVSLRSEPMTVRWWNRSVL